MMILMLVGFFTVAGIYGGIIGLIVGNLYNKIKGR